MNDKKVWGNHSSIITDKYATSSNYCAKNPNNCKYSLLE